MVTDSGAEKLSMSRIAPLVAAGRGYKTISGDPRPFCEEVGIDMRAKTGGQIKRILAASPDVMVMPWYVASDVSYASQHGTAPSVASRQLRPNPAHLQIDENGRASKYAMLANNPNVLGVHLHLLWLTKRKCASVTTLEEFRPARTGRTCEVIRRSKGEDGL
jgi:hypothetical protein